jgi:hypothetical protein
MANRFHLNQTVAGPYLPDDLVLRMRRVLFNCHDIDVAISIRRQEIHSIGRCPILVLLTTGNFLTSCPVLFAHAV